MSNIELEIEAAAEDARNSFDLGELLGGRAFNQESVTVFTDEKAGKELGGLYTTYNTFGNASGVEAKGVLGRIYELRAKEGGYDAEEMETLIARAEELTEALEASALVVELRSIDEDIKKVAKMKAKKALGIRGKVSSDDEEEYNRKDFAFCVARSLLSITRADGSRRTRFSVVDAEYLRDKLPNGEFSKLHSKVMELSYKAAIAQDRTIGNLDFSPAG